MSRCITWEGAEFPEKGPQCDPCLGRIDSSDSGATALEAWRAWGDCDSICSRTHLWSSRLSWSLHPLRTLTAIVSFVTTLTPRHRWRPRGQSRRAVACGWLQILQVCRSMQTRRIGLPSRIYVATCRTTLYFTLSHSGTRIVLDLILRSCFWQFSTWELSSQSLTKLGFNNK